MKALLARTALVLAILLPLVSCSKPDAGTEITNAVQKGVDQFRELMAREQYQEIYQTSYVKGWAYGDEERVVRFLKSAHDALGKFTCGTIRPRYVDLTQDWKYVEFNYFSAFEKGGGAEVFVFRIKGDAIQLVDYRVQPDALPFIPVRSIWVTGRPSTGYHGHGGMWMIS